jgi:hypothetical protein
MPGQKPPNPGEGEYRRLESAPQVWLAVAPDCPAEELARIESVLGRAFTRRSTIDRVLIQLTREPGGWRVGSAWSENVAGERSEVTGIAWAVLRLAGVPLAPA